jgi:hypothetical protein
MDDEPARQDPSRNLAPRSGRFRRHELELADGGRLVLHTDGSIHHVDEHGSTARSWAPDDPEWPDQAIRFGLHPQAPTITPQGRRVQASRPPRG